MFSSLIRRWLALVGSIWALGSPIPGRAFTVTEGYIVVSSGAPVYQSDLDTWLVLYMPANVERLLFFTQCFGGNFVDQFNFSSNTAVASAQERDKVAYYGGYHYGASLEFGPGPGRTGQTPHDSGIAARNPLENPQSGGMLPLTSFSLSDNNNLAELRKHRRVLVHAGSPDGYWDELDASHILNNFVSQPLTTVETIGKNGGAGIWDFAGTAKSLLTRIQQAGSSLAAQPAGLTKQFLLFVTDHGGLAQVSKPDFFALLPPGGSAIQPLSTFSPSSLAAEALLQDPDNHPGLVIVVGMVPPDHTVVYDALGNASYAPLFAAGDWSAKIQRDFPAGPADVFSSGTFMETFVDLDGDGLLTGAGEGVQLFFPMDESLLLGSDLYDIGQDVMVRVSNATQREFQLVSVGLVTGDVRKVVPEPEVAHRGVLLGFILLARIRRPRARPAAPSTPPV